MKHKVIYYTQSGNTKKIADAIGNALSCPVETVTSATDEGVDLLFLGASVYKFGMDKNVVAFVKTLDPQKIGKVAIFSTSAGLEIGYAKLSALLEKQGIPVLEDNFYCRAKFLGMSKERPNEEDLANAVAFAQKVCQANP